MFELFDVIGAEIGLACTPTKSGKGFWDVQAECEKAEVVKSPEDEKLYNAVLAFDNNKFRAAELMRCIKDIEKIGTTDIKTLIQETPYDNDVLGKAIAIITVHGGIKPKNEPTPEIPTLEELQKRVQTQYQQTQAAAQQQTTSSNGTQQFIPPTVQQPIDMASAMQDASLKQMALTFGATAKNVDKLINIANKIDEFNKTGATATPEQLATQFNAEKADIIKAEQLMKSYSALLAAVDHARAEAYNTAYTNAWTQQHANFMQPFTTGA